MQIQLSRLIALSKGTDFERIFSPMTSESIKSAFIQRYNANKPSPVADFTVFDKIDVIGKGAFSIVILYRDRIRNSQVAFKRILKSNIMTENQFGRILHEKKIMAALDCPFIIKLICSYKDNDAVYLGTPFMAGGDLLCLLKRYRKLSEEVARFIAAQILLAIEYMHSLDVIHRDIKPENILFDNNGYVKVGDLGLSKIVDKRLWSFCGTPEYLSPEIIRSRGYSTASDWWSFGVLIYEICFGRSPFINASDVNANNNMAIYGQILSGAYTIPDTFSASLRHLISNLLQVDISKRLGCMKNGLDDIKAHKWFSEMDWNALTKQRLKAPFIPALNAMRGKYVDEKYFKSSTCQYEMEFAEF